MKDIVDLCKAKVIWAKGSAFILLQLCRNSRELCGVSETNLKEGDFPLCPSRSCELKDRELDHRRTYNPNLQSYETMGTGIRHTILFLVLVSSVFINLPHAKGGCSGACAVSGGGEASYNFMGDPAVTIDMSSFDEFVRDNLGDPQATLQAKPLSGESQSNTNSSLNQTGNGNSSLNISSVRPVINSPGTTTSDNRTVKLGALGMQDKRLTNLVFTAFNNNMF